MAVKAPPHALGSLARAYSRASTKGLCAGPCRAGRCACTEPCALRSPQKSSGALQGDLRAGGDTGPQEVLDALAAACARGAGRPLAAWAAAAFRAAGALGLPPGDAAALGPRHCLRLLLMRGPAAAPVRRAPARRSRAVAASGSCACCLGCGRGGQPCACLRPARRSCAGCPKGQRAPAAPCPALSTLSLA